ncbi:MAG TPA: sigma-70 family RNA polymerase sigma factor [Gaiellaceae bacterium]
MAQSEQREWSDEDLVALYNRFFGPLYDVAVRVLGSQADAAAALGRTFARARADLERHPVDEARPWLFGLLAAELPRRRPSRPSEIHRYATVDPDHLANPQAVLRDERIADEVWAAVSSLPVEDYLLLDLQLRHGLRDSELVRALRVDARSLDTRMGRLRDDLEEAVDSPISPVAVFAALAPVPPPPGLQQEVWAGLAASPPPQAKRERTPVALPRKPVVIAAGIALLAAAATAGAFIVTRSAGVHDPTSVHSTSHSTEHGSADSTVEIAWNPSGDASGYSISWTAEPAEPDKTVDLPGTATGTTGHLKPGTHWFNLATRGTNGHWTGTVHLGPFLILPDTVVPNTTITGGPRKYGTAVSTFEFSSNEPEAALECSLDGGEFSACTSPKTYKGLDKGRHTFRVRAVDGAGNIDPTPARSEWDVDTKAPNTELTDSPSDYAQASARFAFRSSEPKSSFECRLDDGKYEPCSSPKTYTGLQDGKHRFRVKSVDRAGNPDPSPESRGWTADTHPPETTIDSGPPNVAHKDTATFTLSSEAGASFECKLDGRAWKKCGAITGLSNGKHILRARAEDRAGNVDPTPSQWRWRVDLPPQTTIKGGPSGPTARTSATFRFSSNDSAATFECRLDDGAWSSCSSGKSYTSLSQGKHVFRVRAKDASGTADPSAAKRTWKVDTAAPNTTITSGPKSSTGSSSATFTFSSSEGDVTFQCRLDGGSWQSCSSPRRYEGLKKGSHVFRVRSVDGAGNVDATPDAWSWAVHR